MRVPGEIESGVDVMNKLTDWIKSHQIAAFFIITFAITWGLGFSYIAFYKGMFLLLPLGFIATCGPALAGIIISAVSNTQPRQGSKKAPRIAFLIAWVVSALVWLAHTTFIERIPFSPALVGLTVVSVVPVAFVISMAYSRIPAVKRYLSSLTRLRGAWGWSLLAMVFYPALILLSIPVSSLLGRQPIAAHQLPETGLALIGLIALQFFYQFLFFNATGEEVGWRGFALPRLQARTSPVIASLILACFWVPWHFFLWQSQGQAVTTWSFWISNGALIILSSIITAWFYNHSKGSILVAGIVHAAENTTARLLLVQDWYVYLGLKMVVALVIILVDQMWKRLPSDHPAVYREPALDEGRIAPYQEPLGSGPIQEVENAKL
jgi:membrane protease YdiL (CAAX protease family)